jgi:DNA invertase Pin-like site-specific DNA recombinase
VYLRRKIGADLRPFTPIASRPRNHLRYHRIVAEIRQLEAGDVLVVTKLNRLARSTLDLLRIIDLIGKEGATSRALAIPGPTPRHRTAA